MATLTLDIKQVPGLSADLIALASQGNEIVVAQGETPLVRVVPIPAEATSGSLKPRVAGLNAGSIWVSDDFDAPLPDEFWFGDETAS